MKVESIFIKKFRAFNNCIIHLGKKLTIIAGQNGTQKTTLLGLLSQPFSITDKTNPMFSERPLCGGNYKSAFSEKFKLSERFDFPKNHEWTLNFDDESSPFTIESISRDGDKIRFWQKGDKSKGSGYIQMPVIYLSLSRLFPIGEDKTIAETNDEKLTLEEQKFYQTWHNIILIMPTIEITQIPVLKSSNKTTAGVNTISYDWKMNSAGQDNLGKILLAILSFKRLKEKYAGFYNGGILVIDEMDATLYPASQIKLFNALLTFSSKFDIQIFCTTHSLSILEQSCNSLSPDVKTVFLQKIGDNISSKENISFDEIRDCLNVTLTKQEITKKIIFTEDHEAYLFLKGILKSSNMKYFKHANTSLGCDDLINLVERKVPGFCEHDSLVILDGDIVQDYRKKKKINHFKNIICLPGNDSPEKLLAEFLYNLSETDELWDKLNKNYTKQFTFKNYSFEDIKNGKEGKKAREISKDWFKEQLPYWGRDGAKLISAWSEKNSEKVEEFIKKVMSKYKL